MIKGGKQASMQAGNRERHTHGTLVFLSFLRSTCEHEMVNNHTNLLAQLVKHNQDDNENARAANACTAMHLDVRRLLWQLMSQRLNPFHHLQELVW